MKISIYTYWKLAKPRQFKQLQNTAPQALIDSANISTATWLHVQHRSFGKPSFLDPWSSIIETQDSILAFRDSILASRNSKHLSFETRGSSFELRVSTQLLSGTFELGEEMKNDVINMSWARDKEKSESPAGTEPMTFRTLVGCSNCYKGLVASWAIIIFKVHVWHASWPGQLYRRS